MVSEIRPGAALSPPPRACALLGCRSGAALGLPLRCRHQAHGVTAPQTVEWFTLRVCIFPLCPHRQHCQPWLWPFPLPPRTQYRVLLTAARGTWQNLTPSCPLSQPGSPWGCPSSRSSPDRSQLCYFPSRQVLIIIHLHNMGNGCNSRKAGCLTRAAEGLP